jgi:predicted helicase
LHPIDYLTSISLTRVSSSPAGPGSPSTPSLSLSLSLSLSADPAGSGDGEIVDGYRRIDNITDTALAKWRAAYPSTGSGTDGQWSKDDVFFYVYGLLHSPDYRERYAADLKKMLPRIPLVATGDDARAFAEAGRRLSELHIGYESVEPYPLEGLDAQPGFETGLRPSSTSERDEAAYDFYAVGDKKMRFGVSTGSTGGGRSGSGGREKDRSVIHYNSSITVSGIPEAAYRYQLGSRSAVEWIIDRYYIKTDKASGIVNDPNDWSREVGDPRYILDLLARVVTVSVETMKIVDALPALTIREEQ